MKFNLKASIPYLLPLVIIFIVNLLYFLPHFEGKVPNQGDMVQAAGMAKEINTFSEKEDRSVLWTNSMFGGMPSFQIGGLRHNNYLSYTQRFFSFFLEPYSPPSLIVTGMVSFYIMMLLLGINPWLSLIGALFFGFSTNNMILIDAGHPTKLYAICYSPLVIAGVLLSFRQKYILGSAIFGLGLGLNIASNHVQMTYYLGLCLAILVLVYFVQAIKRKHSLIPFCKSVAFLGIAAILAVGSSASSLWPTYEYSKDTMRGKPILAATSDTDDASSSSTKDGLAWDYAMQWSNGAKDLLASFIPKAVGGGSGEWLDGKSSLAKAVGQRQTFQAPTYWGDLPFTSGPIYFGAVACLLFIFGLFVIKGPTKWWLAGAVLMTILISMGKHFEFLNRLLFDYLPLMNKFRTPNSILSVTAVLIPIAGILGLSSLTKEDDKSKFLKPLYYSIGILGGLAFIMILLGNSLFDFASQGDEQYAQIKDALLDQRQEMLRSSSIRSLMFILFSGATIWLYIKNKISSTILLTFIGILGMIDLVSVDRDYFNKRNFVTPTVLKAENDPRPVDTQILQDKDPYYRVYDATINTFNSASSSYFHKTIGGYHAAKLQRYQDIIDRQISNNNQAVLNMLNTKYFIYNGQDGQPMTQMNPAALGNAWFVNEITVVDNPNAEIDSLNGFDPATKAIVHKEFAQYISGLSLNKNGKINLTKYSPDKLEYEYETEGQQLAVFSDIWYGPNKGWQAYIDGKPVDHIRADYLLRALKLPSGKHTVVFDFKPNSYYLGNKISAISSILLLVLLGYSLWHIIRKSD
ncbi:MAG: YfhO family protein, partial [Saprospiraceae bacterium]